MRTVVACLCLAAIPCLAAWVSTFFAYSRETPRIEIYHGVYYQTTQLPNGLAHLVEVDLTCPGIDLFLTPIQPDAAANGHEYRLDYVRNVARAEGLAVAVNGGVFNSDSYLVPMVGDFATSRDTIVAERQLNHLNPRNYILWFDDDLTPHAEATKPAPLAALQKARWAIGGIDLAISGRKLRLKRDGLETRTILGLNPDRKTLWIGIFESATRKEATELMMNAGADHVMTLDGGASTSLYFGGRTRGVQRGLQVGGQRPVATVIGIKADPILDPL
jgi:hypothetical protein